MENKNINEEILKAQEHDVSDAQLTPAEIAEAGKIITEDVVGTYKKIEDAVVGTYKKVEKAAVDAYHNTEDFFVEKLFAKEGETVEEAKERLNGKK